MALSRQLLLIGKRNYDFGVLVFGKAHVHEPPNTIGASLHAIQGPVLVIALEEKSRFCAGRMWSIWPPTPCTE